MSAPPTLYLTSGFLDDPREPLLPGHALYRWASHAHHWQGSWDDAQHGEYFAILLRERGGWPRERATMRELRALVVDYLMCEHSFSRAQTAGVLGLAPDSIRARTRPRPRGYEGVGLDLLRTDGFASYTGSPRWHLAHGLGRTSQLRPPRHLTRVPRVTIAGETLPEPPYRRTVGDDCAPKRKPAERAEIERLLVAAERALLKPLPTRPRGTLR